MRGNEERRKEGMHIHTHRTYSWDRQPSIMVSGKIGFSASSTDQESKHVSFHLTVGCKVISRSNNLKETLLPVRRLLCLFQRFA